LEKIPILDLTPEVNSLWAELEEAALRVLRSTQYIGGPEVENFKSEVSSYLEVEHVVPLNSGTDALVIALDAAGIGHGDEVITSAFTFFATAEAISSVGATPVFADIDRRTMNLDPSAIASKITAATKAIIPVHLFGHAARMDDILEIAARHNLFVLEDVAQAFSGAYKERKLGTLGDAGAYSFFPSKNLGGFGDGGLLATNNSDLAARVQMLAVHGSRKKYYNEAIGYNSRLDSLQAALLRVKLRYINELTEGRRHAAAIYNELLEGHERISTPHTDENTFHVFHQYTIQLSEGIDRTKVQEELAAEGISSFVYYPVALHQLPVYRALECSLPVTESVCSRVLSLPIWPSIDRSTQEQVVQGLLSAVSSA